MSHFLAIMSHLPPQWPAQSEAKRDIVCTTKAGPDRSRDPLTQRESDQSVMTVSNASGFASSQASTASASRPSPYSLTTMSSSDP